MGNGRLAYPFPLWLLHPAVLLSGATALAYEIVWTRRLALLLGSTTGALVAVLSTFMLGLALGALAIGRRADSSRQPLRWYGLLEIGIGLFAVAFDSLLGIVGGSLVGACGLLLVPTALMGGTLPVLARAAAHTTERGTLALGSLYGTNTLGAVAGALLTSLFFLEWWGLRGTVAVAAAVNIAMGLLFWGLAFAAGERPIPAREEEALPSRWSGDAGLAVLLPFFLAGFAGLLLQVAWVRLLIYFLEGFTIAFGLMLAAYLLGLGAGALCGSPIAVQSPNPRRLLARLLLLEAVAALGTLPLAGPLGEWLEAMRSSYQAAESMDFAYGMRLFLAAAAVVLPATFLAGMLMPVVARITLSDRDAIGRHAGVVYGASTLGAVLAPAAAGFWLIPALSVPGAIALGALLLLVAGSAIALSPGTRAHVAAAAAAAALVALALASNLREPLVLRSHVFAAAKSPRRLLEFREGRMAGVSVVEELRDGSRRLYLDDFSAAETGAQYGYMRLLAHLPLLLHPNPERVLVIAFGTGTTAGAAAVHEEVAEVTCVEIEPAVYDVARHFKRQNRDVLADPKVRRVVADGREFVGRGGAHYDVVTLEPLMPYSPAAVYLYTSEFYRAARSSMRRDGILCQWIPPHGVSSGDLKRLVASVAEVFPHVSLWYFEHAVLVVGAPSRPRIEWATFRERASRPEILSDLQHAHVGGPAHLLGAFLCGGEALAAALGTTPPMVDDRTDLEFRPVPRRFGKLSLGYHAANLEFLLSIHQPAMDWFADPEEPVAEEREGVRRTLATLAQETRARLEGGTELRAAALADVIEGDRGALFARSVHDRRRFVELMREEPPRIDEAARLSYAPDRSAAYLALAREAAGEKRLYYLTLAVRENALCGEEELRQLAGALEGPERRFCENRLAALRGEALEEGEERLPEFRLPDITSALEAWDEEKAREMLDDADKADMRREAEARIEEWIARGVDPRRAAAFLHRIGSRHALRVALKLLGTDMEPDLVAIAPLLAAYYPDYPYWARLCDHSRPHVRAMAAEAARESGGVAHLAKLAALLNDKEPEVRLSAWFSFCGILPEAASIPYQPAEPTEESIARVVALAERAARHG